MRVNLHIPFLARQARDDARTLHIGQFYNRLKGYLDRREDLDVSYSAERKRPKHLGEDAYSINYHTRICTQRHLNVKNSYLPGFFYADAKGFSGWSEVADRTFDPADIPVAEARSYYAERIWEPVLRHGISKFAQPTDKVDLPKDYIFLPLQVPNDAVMKLANFSQERLIRVMRRMSWDVPLVIKVHPQTRKTDRSYTRDVDALHDPKAGVYVVDGHVHDLIAGARAVVCTNSGAGMEAILLGKPVITCGKADYRHMALEAKGPKDVEKLLEQVEAPSMRRVRKYATWYFGQQMLDQTRPVSEWADELILRLKATEALAPDVVNENDLWEEDLLVDDWNPWQWGSSSDSTVSVTHRSSLDLH